MTPDHALLRLPSIALRVSRAQEDWKGREVARYETDVFERSSDVGLLACWLVVELADDRMSIAMEMSAGAERRGAALGSPLEFGDEGILAAGTVWISEPPEQTIAGVAVSTYHQKAEGDAFGFSIPSIRPDVTPKISEAMSAVARHLLEQEPRLIEGFLAAAAGIHASDRRDDEADACTAAERAKASYLKAISLAERMFARGASDGGPLETEAMKDAAIEALGVRFVPRVGENASRRVAS